MPSGQSPHVVILGGGFGGLYAARALRHSPVRVTLVDRRNHHLFQPLLYQVATAALNPSDIAVPIRRILRKQKNASVILALAIAIDRAGKRVILSDGELTYDYLIVATGATHSYFGHDEWSRVAPGLKTIEDALEIRRRILLAYEAAERETEAGRRREWLTFAVIGGGPTGVELAGALAGLSRQILRRDFRSIDPGEARIVLIEGGPRILPSFSTETSVKAARMLERLGAEVLTGAPVTDLTDGSVLIGDHRIPTRTVLWAAGVAASPLVRSLGLPLDRAGRAPVESDLTIPGSPDVFVIGDLARVMQDGAPVPGIAPAAIQEGRHAARNIRRALRGMPLEPFHYRDEGSLATIGRAAAVAEFGRVRLSGWIAWIAWLLIHIYFLIGFRNRLLVLLQWAWLYLRYEGGARLITGDVGALLEGERDRLKR
jgi:NADH:quinone reductase (non-electrogenic)